MGCIKCGHSSCNGTCGTSVAIQQVVINNGEGGADGEDAYEAYVRAGGELPKHEWALLNEKNVYKEFNWK